MGNLNSELWIAFSKRREKLNLLNWNPNSDCLMSIASTSNALPTNSCNQSILYFAMTIWKCVASRNQMQASDFKCAKDCQSIRELHRDVEISAAMYHPQSNLIFYLISLLKSNIPLSIVKPNCFSNKQSMEMCTLSKVQGIYPIFNDFEGLDQWRKRYIWFRITQFLWRSSV